MSIVIKVIPYVEIFFILMVLGLGCLSYLSSYGTEKQRNQNRSKLKWILSGLFGLALLSIILLIFISFSQE